ncbi:hypothetical protein [uncultured Microbacterium sp.]|uniref:hypothetical protein n=1 Tax=uncultured Microbacterium sp. TaxID=191216 RepID=UPI0028D517E8|nr:hypothetical protein [uncultured Microbacterium sp.]
MTENPAGEEATPEQTVPPQRPAGIPPVPPLPPLPPAAQAAAAPPAPPYATEQYPTLPYGSSAPHGYDRTAWQPSGPVQGYAPPQMHGYAPPEGYTAPVQGYGPYVAAPGPAAPRGGATLGIVALVLAVLATVAATIVGSIAAFSIGVGTGRQLVVDPADIDFDWSILTPVREWVLVGELSFWAGTILGVWALVQGIVAIVKNRGRGWGIAAVVVAAIGPIAFAIAVQVFLTTGFASGASAGG